jgi:hypothetical protein
VVSLNPDIAQLITKQIAIAQDNMAKLIAEQIAVALAAQRSRRSQTPSNPNRHRQDSSNWRRQDSSDQRRLDTADRRRPDFVINTVEPLASHDTHFWDGLIRGTEAQELSNGLDLTFDV